MPATNYAGKSMDYLGQRIRIGSFVGPDSGGEPCIVTNEEQPIGFSMFYYAYTHTLPGFQENYDYEDYLYYHDTGGEPVINPATGQPYQEGDIMIDPDTLEPYRVTVTSTRDIETKFWYPIGDDGVIRWAFGIHQDGESGLFGVYFKFSTGEWSEEVNGETVVHPAQIIQNGDQPSGYDIATLSREGWNYCWHQYWQGGATGVFDGFPRDITPDSLDFLKYMTLTTIDFYAYNLDGVSSGSATDSVAFRSWWDAGKPYNYIYVQDKFNNWGPDKSDQFVIGVFNYDVKENSNWIAIYGLREPFSGYPLPLMSWNGPTTFMGDQNNTVTCYQGWGNQVFDPSNAYCLGGGNTGTHPSNTLCPLDCGTIVNPDDPYPDPYDDSHVFSDDDDDTPVPTDPEDPNDNYHPEGFDGKTSDDPLPGLDITSTGLYQLYLPTPSQLQEFSSWLWTEDYKDAIAEWNMDPMSQIVMFGMVPFKATAGTAGVVHMAGVSTGISMTKAASMWVQVTTGTVQVPGPVNSWLDFTSTKYMLYLPLVGFVPLVTDDIIWSKMYIKYKCNIVTGEFVAQVWVAKSLKQIGFGSWGEFQILYSYNGNCLFNLPLNGANYGAYYASKKNDIMGIIGDLGSTIGGAVGGFMMGGPAGAVAGGLLAGANSVNGIFDKATHLANAAPEVQRSGSLSGSTCLLSHSSPYIICNQPRKYTKGYYSQYGYNTYRGDQKLGAYNGWVYCSKVKVTCSGTETEQEMISKLLRDGVYIKK